jgi:hypothetical protein
LDEALLYSQLSVPLKACCRREVAERRGAEDLHLLATDKITKEFFNLRLPVNTEVFIQANLQQCTASSHTSKPERFFEQEKINVTTLRRLRENRAAQYFAA